MKIVGIELYHFHDLPQEVQENVRRRYIWDVYTDGVPLEEWMAQQGEAFTLYGHLVPEEYRIDRIVRLFRFTELTPESQAAARAELEAKAVPQAKEDAYHNAVERVMMTDWPMKLRLSRVEKNRLEGQTMYNGRLVTFVYEYPLITRVFGLPRTEETGLRACVGPILSRVTLSLDQYIQEEQIRALRNLEQRYLYFADGRIAREI